MSNSIINGDICNVTYCLLTILDQIDNCPPNCGSIQRKQDSACLTRIYFCVSECKVVC